MGENFYCSVSVFSSYIRVVSFGSVRILARESKTRFKFGSVSTTTKVRMEFFRLFCIRVQPGAVKMRVRVRFGFCSIPIPSLL